MKAHFILYVADQAHSAAFYSQVLGVSPTLNVPGMTEFEIGDAGVLGLMPEAGVKRLFGERVGTTNSGARAEIYLIVDDAKAYHERALAAGATEISKIELRDWGHLAAYSLDLDGHVLAFAEPAKA